MIYIEISSRNLLIERVKALYLDSFPPEERRDFNMIIDLLNDESVPFHMIIAQHDDNHFAAFMTYWDFGNFLYIEHFAVDPKLRGHKIGEQFLSHIITEFSKPIILEVEAPDSEMARRRIRFYERNGFELLDIPYLQPPYSIGKLPIELKLMLNQPNFEVSDINNYICTIKAKVYNVKQY